MLETTEREKGVITEMLATMADKDSAPVSVGLLRHVARDVDTLVEALGAALAEAELFRGAWQKRSPADPEQMALRTVLKRKVEDPLRAVLGGE